MNQSELEAKKLEKRMILLIITNTLLTLAIILLLPNPSDPVEKLRVLGAIVLLLMLFSLSNATGIVAMLQKKNKKKND